MKNLLFQGIYDKQTFERLRQIGVSEFAFDLRPEGANFITLNCVKEILDQAKSEKFFLIFSRENKEIIRSYKNLLRSYPFNLITIISDNSQLNYLNQMEDFYWTFNPLSNWHDILQLGQLKGVFLPIDFQDFYKLERDVWTIVENRNLDVYLQARNFNQTHGLEFDADLKLSINLTSEVESSYRKIDFEKLNRLNIRSLLT